ncbi:MAG: restriction endonuclease [Deltaproteobacteria bacterium]|nr:restriction endonuclease [Deltaproteobacteria bacterium]
MPSADEYVHLARSYDWEDLQSLWKDIMAGNTPGWPPGKALEHLVLRAFELNGAEVVWPFEVKISGKIAEQIDGVVYSDGLICLVECKDTNEREDVEPIAKLQYKLLRRPSGVLGALISKNGFTDPAIRLAQYQIPKAILLWEGNDISFALEKRSITNALRLKYRIYVEHGAPDYLLREEETQ